MALLRKPRLRDITNIMRIEDECFESPWTASSFYVLLRYNGRFGDSQGEIVMMVLENQSTLIGYIVWEYDFQEREGHILNIAVKKDEQRKGFGRKLMEHALDHLRGINAASCFLEVRESNSTARRLYASMGMIPVDRVDRYYGNEDAVIYHISLESI